MLNKRIFFLIFIGILFPLISPAKTHTDKLLAALHNPNKKYVFVIAHRGDWRNAPENSLDAIRRSIELGVDMVEIDIQKTKDGEFVLMHDNKIDRTTTGKGAVADYTVEELKKFRLRNGNGIKTYAQIPTLKEALSACKDKILVNIDKGGNYIKEITPILKETGTEKQVIIKGSYPVNKVKAEYGDNTDMLYMPIVTLGKENAEKQIDAFLESYGPIAFEICFKNETDLDSRIINKILQKGSRVWINTLWDTLCGGHDDEQAVNYDPDANWGWILKQKATMIQTDRPKELIDYLQSKKLRKLK